MSDESPDRRGLRSVVAAVGALVVVALPLGFALLGGLVAWSDCALPLFGTCVGPSPWWVGAKFFLAAAILALVPVVAGTAAWQRSSSRGYAAVGLFVVGVVTIYLPTPQ